MCNMRHCSSLSRAPMSAKFGELIVQSVAELIRSSVTGISIALASPRCPSCPSLSCGEVHCPEPSCPAVKEGTGSLLSNVWLNFVAALLLVVFAVGFAVGRCSAGSSSRDPRRPLGGGAWGAASPARQAAVSWSS